ncbi:pseudouridine synthase [Spirochaetia bacterium]|nr:pseudouridine synthase [Spirochaetia bacterium]
MSLNEAEGLRLQVYLAHAGAASRRSSEKLIAAGRVAVNGKTVTAMGEKVLPGDTVTLDGKPLEAEGRFHYLALHKPPEYLCSAFDPQGRPLARELLPQDIRERLYSVGRLDFRSAGLIIFTNDGDFTAKVSHPSAGIEKEYYVEASGSIPDQVIEEFQRGLMVEDVLYRALKVERTGRKALRVVLVEGKNREIRRVFSHFHLHPLVLKRIRIGDVLLGDLPEGQSRPLTEPEKRALLGG